MRFVIFHSFNSDEKEENKFVSINDYKNMSSDLIWYGTNPNQGRSANYVSIRSIDKENPEINDAGHDRNACAECTIQKVKKYENY